MRRLKSCLTITIILFTCISIYAQVPGCNGFLPPANACADAIPIPMCDLDGYCSWTDTTFTIIPTEDVSFCATLENPSWIAFIADNSALSVDIEVSDCAYNFGIQAQIFATDDCQNFTVVGDCYNPGPLENLSGTVVATNLVPGKVYYMMFDGWASDNCRYMLNFCGTIQPIDADNDGFNSDVDCDDNNAAINPGAMEIANNDIDEDCNGLITFIDADNDGFNSDEDCDDNDASIHPNAMEITNNDIDEDCDGEVMIIDADNDGFNSDIDCDDNDPMINPDATEIENNDIDENCDGIMTAITSTSYINNNNIKAFPNPLTNYLVIEQSSTMHLQYEIIDQTGRTLFVGEFNQNRQTVDLENLSSGMYFLKLYDTTSEKSAIQKLMKL